MSYSDNISQIASLVANQDGNWNAISPEYAARMRMQNRFQNGLDIARYTAAIMRKDMAEYDADSSKYTQSLGCWHGFVGQQKMLAVKKHHGTTDKRYLYLSGWMVAAFVLYSDDGPVEASPPCGDRQEPERRASARVLPRATGSRPTGRRRFAECARPRHERAPTGNASAFSPT